MLLWTCGAEQQAAGLSFQLSVLHAVLMLAFSLGGTAAVGGPGFAASAASAECTDVAAEELVDVPRLVRSLAPANTNTAPDLLLEQRVLGMGTPAAARWQPRLIKAEHITDKLFKAPAGYRYWEGNGDRDEGTDERGTPPGGAAEVDVEVRQDGDSSRVQGSSGASASGH